MAFFQNIRPLIRIAVALERCARSLEYFAVEDARVRGRIFTLTQPSGRTRRDDSDLGHSDPATIAQLRAEERDFILQRGYKELEQQEDEAD